MKINLRKHQKDAVKGVNKAFEEYDKCLVKMFCGTGKTRIVFYLMMNNENNLSVIVFPSIALITQFNQDYIFNKEWKDITKSHKYLSICSKNELSISKNKIKYTTDEEDIKKFIKKKDKKVISVTYKSLDKFINALTDTNVKIDLLVYDEAHHIIGNSIQELVFKNDEFNNQTNKTIFLTATPKNHNGITMLEREYDDIDYNTVDEDETEETNITYKTDCGVLAYEYTHHQAVEDGVCNDFDIAIDLYTDNSYKYKSVYSAIARCIFNTHNKKCLTFHSRSETEHETLTHVLDFVSEDNQERFQKEYNRVLSKEFPKLKKRYRDKLIIDGLTAKTKNKQDILNEFDEDKENARVLASCNTIGEGVDTKNANIVCFVDPKNSYSTIIQNVGRVCRKQEKKSTILIPCYVDANKYNASQTEEERDKIIREEMNENGNFNNILNVLSALREDDPYYYDLLLKYPNKYASSEVKRSLVRQGYRIEQNVGDLHETIQYLTVCELDDIDETEDLEEIGVRLNKKIELYSNSISEFKTEYNTEDDYDDIVRLYYDDETEEYRPITKIDKTKPDKGIKKPQRRRVNIDVYTNNDIKVLWDIKDDFDLTDKVCQAYIESTVKEDKWFERLEEVKKFIDENKKKPKYHNGVQNKIEQKLGAWLSQQLKFYKKKIMINARMAEFNVFINMYEKYFFDNQEEWMLNFYKFKEWVELNQKKPVCCSNDINESQLGRWYYTQKKNYNGEKYIMKNIIIKNLYENFIKDNSKIFLNNVQKWSSNLNKLNSFITENNVLPTHNSKKENERQLARWINFNNRYYNDKKYIMSNEDIYNSWYNFLEKNTEFFKDNEIKWEQQYIKLKEWVDKNNSIPSGNSKDTNEKQLGKWCSHQREYKKNNKLSQYRSDKLETIDIWYWDKNMFSETYNELNKWIVHNGYIPSQKSKNEIEKRLGTWCTCRRMDKRNNKLSQLQIDKLEQLNGWYWGSDEKKEIISFDEMYAKLNGWIKKFKKMPSSTSKNDEEKQLGIWCTSRRKDKKNDKLSLNKIKKLEKVDGWYWERNDPFNDHYNSLLEYVKKYNKIPDSKTKTNDENKLFNWCCNLRFNKKMDKLDKNKIEKMEKVDGWYWDNDDKFNEKYNKLVSWMNINNNFPSKHSKNIEEQTLGRWIGTLRKEKKNNKLSQERIDKLENIKYWFWIKQDPFYHTFDKLKKWIENNNRLPLANSHNKLEKYLGQWCQDKRKSKKQNKLTKEKIEKLEKLKGWYWTKEEKQFSEKSENSNNDLKTEKTETEAETESEDTETELEDTETKEKYSKVKSRNYQQKLREECLDRYDYTCVISGEKKKKSVETCHIKGVSECNKKEKKDIENTLLLSRDIHKYFDEYQITINPETCKVEVKDDDDNEWLMKYDGKDIELTKKNKKYLEHHYEKYCE